MASSCAACWKSTDFDRLSKRYPQADGSLLRRLPEEFEVQFAGANGQSPERSLEQLARLSQTLSNAVQLSPQTGLLAEDLDAELDRLFHDQVEPLHYGRRSEDLSTRNAIRTRVNQVFRSAGIWARLERRVRIDEFTYAGDPMRLDYAYRRNGTQGFVQTLPLGRDPGQAKVLAFTADAIRAKLRQDGISGGLGDRAAAARKCAAPLRHRTARGTRNPRGAAGPPGRVGAAHAALAARSQRRPLIDTNPEKKSSCKAGHSGAPLQNLFVPGFQAPLHQPHELVRDGAVHDAMVVTENSDRPSSEWRWRRRPPRAASGSRRWPEWPRSAG